MGEKDQGRSGAGVGIVVALVVLGVLAVPCIGGVLLLGMISFRTVSEPGQPLSPPMVAPPVTVPVMPPLALEPLPLPADPTAPPVETKSQADKAPAPE